MDPRSLLAKAMLALSLTQTYQPSPIVTPRSRSHPITLRRSLNVIPRLPGSSTPHLLRSAIPMCLHQLSRLCPLCQVIHLLWKTIQTVSGICALRWAIIMAALSQVEERILWRQMAICILATTLRPLLDMVISSIPCTAPSGTDPILTIGTWVTVDPLPSTIEAPLPATIEAPLLLTIREPHPPSTTGFLATAMQLRLRRSSMVGDHLVTSICDIGTTEVRLLAMPLLETTKAHPLAIFMVHVVSTTMVLLVVIATGPVEVTMTTTAVLPGFTLRVPNRLQAGQWIRHTKSPMHSNARRHWIATRTTSPLTLPQPPSRVRIVRMHSEVHRGAYDH
jgi:hypothetical protein